MNARKWLWIALIMLLGLGWGSVALASSAPIVDFSAKDVIYSTAIADNSSLAVVGSRDDHVYAFTLHGHLLWKRVMANAVSSVAVSPHGNFIVAIDQENQMTLYTRSGRQLWDVTLPNTASAVVVGPKARNIWVASQEIPLIFKYNHRGNNTGQMVLPAAAVSMAATPTMDRWVVGTINNQAYLYNGRGRELWSFSTSGTVNGVGISPGGRFVVVGSQDQSAYLLNDHGRLLWSKSFGNAVNAVAVSHGGGRVGVATASDLLAVLNRSGKTLWSLNTGQPNDAMALSENGSQLLAGSQNHTAYFVNISQAASSFASRGQWIVALVIAVGVAVVAAGWWSWRKITRSSKGRRLIYEVKSHRISYIMLIPTFALLLLFNYYPAVSGLYHSLYYWNPGAVSYFVGFANFAQMASDQLLLVGIPHIIILMATGIIFGGLGVPLLVAELMFHLRSERAQYWYRVLFIVPLVIPSVASILIWQNIYEPNVGLLNATLKAVGLNGLTHDWLGNPHLALGALIFMGFPWTNIIAVLVFYAGLLAIPGELIDAARVDGAHLARLIRKIHLPMLTGQFKFVLVTSVIGGLQAFGVQLVMTGGGPENSTFVPGLEMYYAATKYDELGYSAAISVSMFIIIMVMTIIQMKYIKSTAVE